MTDRQPRATATADVLRGERPIMHSNTRRTMAALGLAITVALAACGGDDDGGASPPAATDATVAPTGAPATTTGSAATEPSETEPSETEPTGTVATGTEPTTAATSADTAASAEWESIVAAAEDESSVTIYSSQGLPELTDLEGRFEAAYGIDLVVVRGLPQDLVPRIEVERQTGRGEADVYVSADQQWVVQANTDGYYVETVGPDFDNPDYDRERDMPEGTYFKSNAVVFGYGWNTDAVPDA